MEKQLSNYENIAYEDLSPLPENLTFSSLSSTIIPIFYSDDQEQHLYALTLLRQLNKQYPTLAFNILQTYYIELNAIVTNNNKIPKYSLQTMTEIMENIQKNQKISFSFAKFMEILLLTADGEQKLIALKEQKPVVLPKNKNFVMQLNEENSQMLYLYLTKYFLKLLLQFHQVDLVLKIFKTFIKNFALLNKTTSKKVFKILELLFKGFQSNFDKIEELFEIVRMMKFKPNDKLFNKIIDFIAKNNDNTQISEYIFDEMVQNKIEPTIITYNILLDSYFKHNQQQKALELYEQLQKKQIDPDSFTYTTLIHGLKNCKPLNLNQIFTLFEKLKLKNKPDQIIYNCLLDSCIQVNEIKKAEDLFEQMKRENIQADIITYNTLIKGCIIQQNYQKGIDYLSEMKICKIIPNQITYNSLIDMFVKCGIMNKAWSIYEEMINAQIIPDNFTYSIIINGIKQNSKSKNELVKALRFIEEIQIQNNFQPDEILYNSLIDACISFDEPEMALNLYQEMLTKRIQPSNITYGILIKAYGKLNDLENAFKIFEELKEQNQQINDITYGCLLNACVKSNKLELALLLFEEMKNDNIELNTIIYTTLIQGFTKAQQIEEALKVFELMKENKYSQPNLITYNQIINTCIKSKNLQKAIGLFNEMENNLKPDLITYSTIIKGFINEFQFDQIEKYLNQMIQQKVIPDDGLLNQILEACFTSKEVNLAMKIFKLIKQLHLPTSAITFGIMMKIFCQNRQLNQAIHLLEIMKKQNIFPNIIIYTTLISACFNARKIQKALNFYEKMKTDLIKLDGICYQQLIQGALKNNQIDLAIEFLREANQNKMTLNCYIFKNLTEKIKQLNLQDKESKLEEIQLSQKLNFQFKKTNDYSFKQPKQEVLYENTTFKNQQETKVNEENKQKDQQKKKKQNYYKENYSKAITKKTDLKNENNNNNNNSNQNQNKSFKSSLIFLH